ncbi:hypothetical protein RO3G_15786 [Rhizopus delemar RA 99-880]|uniref:Uncharacterized protein n=1 Tax=Rhizopus delemar (strain RA 99-880 / ATCC MYA-4621 / FGSC 9543 / NRRL 43880) TaxID=246409 RepID=I1CRJ5_RHIO9|nr:hypothetical protein RO3G_15786 [Rhizopus delemar RA 99-880]|eukprot:EIE91075.1 hypothetical protein RO3G_15786 [Rhizopus delemar RA 99-880]
MDYFTVSPYDVVNEVLRRLRAVSQNKKRKAGGAKAVANSKIMTAMLLATT